MLVAGYRAAGTPGSSLSQLLRCNIPNSFSTAHQEHTKQDGTSASKTNDRIPEPRAVPISPKIARFSDSKQKLSFSQQDDILIFVSGLNDVDDLEILAPLVSHVI